MPGCLLSKSVKRSNCIRDRGAIDWRQPIGLPRLRNFISRRRQSELQIRSIGLNLNGLPPVIQGGIVSSSVQQNLGQPVQRTDQLRVDGKGFAKFGFRGSGVGQHRAERATRLQQARDHIAEPAWNSSDRSVVLLLTLPDKPEIEMGFGRVRVQPKRLVKGRNGTFEVALLGKPDADSVVYLRLGSTCGRVGSRRRRFAGRRQLRRCFRGDQQQKNAADEQPA